MDLDAFLACVLVDSTRMSAHSHRFKSNRYLLAFVRMRLRSLFQNCALEQVTWVVTVHLGVSPHYFSKSFFRMRLSDNLTVMRFLGDLLYDDSVIQPVAVIKLLQGRTQAFLEDLYARRDRLEPCGATFRVSVEQCRGVWKDVRALLLKAGLDSQALFSANITWLQLRSRTVVLGEVQDRDVSTGVLPRGVKNVIGTSLDLSRGAMGGATDLCYGCLLARPYGDTRACQAEVYRSPSLDTHGLRMKSPGRGLCALWDDGNTVNVPVDDMYVIIGYLFTPHQIAQMFRQFSGARACHELRRREDGIYSSIVDRVQVMVFAAQAEKELWLEKYAMGDDRAVEPHQLMSVRAWVAASASPSAAVTLATSPSGFGLPPIERLSELVSSWHPCFVRRETSGPCKQRGTMCPTFRFLSAKPTLCMDHYRAATKPVKTVSCAHHDAVVLAGVVAGAVSASGLAPTAPPVPMLPAHQAHHEDDVLSALDAWFL